MIRLSIAIIIMMALQKNKSLPYPHVNLHQETGGRNSLASTRVCLEIIGRYGLYPIVSMQAMATIVE